MKAGIKIEKFDKTSLKLVSQEIDAALKTLSEQFGIKLNRTDISFDAGTFTTKLQGKVPSLAITDYSEIYPFMNLPPIGTKFTVAGKTLEVTEHKINRPKYPVQARGEDGKYYKFDTQTVHGAKK